MRPELRGPSHRPARCASHDTGVYAARAEARRQGRLILPELLTAAGHLFHAEPANVVRPVARDRGVTSSWAWRHKLMVNGRTITQRERCARWAVIWVLYERGLPFLSIAQVMGLDHSSVIYAIRKTAADDRLQEELAPLVDQFARTGRIAS